MLAEDDLCSFFVGLLWLSSKGLQYPTQEGTMPWRVWVGLRVQATCVEPMFVGGLAEY